MKNIILKISISFILTGILAIYALVLFGLPKVLNSEKYIAKYEKFLNDKTGLLVKINNFYLKITPLLGIKISIDSIDSKDSLKIQNLKYNANLFNLKKGYLDADSIFIEAPMLRKDLQINSQNRDKQLNLKYFPVLNLKNISVVLDKNSNLKVDYIKSKKHRHKIEVKMNAKLDSKNLKYPLFIGKTGSIIYGKDLSFDNFSIQTGGTKLLLTGNQTGLKIFGKDLPAGELKDLFLHYYKFKHPYKKNFIENFYNLAGYLDIDLWYKNGKFSGDCTARELNALFFDYKIPIYLPKTVFYFKDKNIDAQTSGKFGPNHVKTDFHVRDIASKNVTIFGSVSSPFTNELTKKYYPQVGIEGVADALVKYKNVNGKVNVDYILTLKKGNDLTFGYGGLGNNDKTRKIFARTVKTGDNIDLTEYSYSYLSDQSEYKLLTGKGSFSKVSGKYRPNSFTLKTNQNVTVNVLSPFIGDYIKGGTFDADLKYDFKPGTLVGGINVYNTSHSDFVFVESANLNIKNNKAKFKADGTFYSSPVSVLADIENSFNNDILIHNIDVHLKDFRVSRTKLSSLPAKSPSKKKQYQQRKYNFTVENGHARVDRIYASAFDVTNVDITGSLRNNVAHFIIPQAQYAQGLLSAKGIYDMNDYSSNIEFFASDIDSNIVATNFFKLPGQIEGTAFATLHLITKDKLNDIKADATFAISDGYLPKIGSQEFVINTTKSKKQHKSKIINKIKSKINFKFTLQKIISNFDFSHTKDSIYTNIYGSFKVDNECVEDVKIFTKSDFLSTFIEGDYDIETQEGNLAIWGRRNKTFAKKIRIFKIPINWIYKIVFRAEHSIDQYKDKIKLIPSITMKLGDDIAIFRIFVSGNLNATDKLKVELKDLR